METQFLGHFAWCIARLVAPMQNFVQQILFLQVDNLSGCSLQKIGAFFLLQIFVQNRLCQWVLKLENVDVLRHNCK